MLFILILILIILKIIIFIFMLTRWIIYQNISKLKKKGKFNQEENLLYDDYYHHSKSKKNNKLICQIGVFRKFIWSDPYLYEINSLRIEPNIPTKLLVVSNYDTNLELEKRLLHRYPKLEIISTTTNILNAKFLQQKIEREKIGNVTVAYTAPEDLSKLWGESKYKFDRILVRECLGNIKDVSKFWLGLKKLLGPNGFIRVRTFTLEPIFENDSILPEKQNREMVHKFETQKKLIDYWNYNFSTTQAVINEITPYFNNIQYSDMKFWKLLFLYNFKEFGRAIQIYFQDMGLKLNNLDDWRGVTSLNILFLEIS